ncbi:MAG: ABC transporter substrate-binding protein [Chloroflexi bacterium]|nr:ABC transporter substrate-binding protein [Chloroflexota bacterium]
MQPRRVFQVISCFMALGLTLASCAQAVAPTLAPTAATPSMPDTPVARPPVAAAAPSPTPKASMEPARYGGVLKHATLTDEASFDPHVNARNMLGDQAGLAYSGLVQFDPEDGRRIIPDLAEGYHMSQDGAKVTFVLRKNVRWHDGKVFTSEDVKFNFDRWAKPPEGVVIARKEIAEPVERVETPDANTVEVYMKYPSPFFIAGIASFSAVMLPSHYLKDRKTMGLNILGTGPFKLKGHSRGVGLQYVKNENYFIAGRPYLDGITQYIVPDETARFAAFRTGQLRTMYVASSNLSPSRAETLKKEMSDKVNVARIPGLSIAVVYLNATRPPFNDVRVRQAVDMALDRKKILGLPETRGETIGPMIRRPWALPDDELMKRPGYRGVSGEDIAKAKALLADAGYPRGFENEVLINRPFTNQAVFMQAELKAIGVEVVVRAFDAATTQQRQESRDFGMSLYFVTQPVDDPNLLLSFYVTGGGRNYGGFSDKQIDDLYKEQSKTMEPAKRREIVLNLQRRILGLAPSPILFHSLYDVPYWRCLEGYYPEKQIANNNLRRQDIWLAEACR